MFRLKGRILWLKIVVNVEMSILPVISMLHIVPMPTELLATHRYVRPLSSFIDKKLTVPESDLRGSGKISVSFSILIDHSKSI